MVGATPAPFRSPTMHMTRSLLAAAMLVALAACDRGASPVQTSESTPPPPEPVAQAPAPPAVDYPGEVDVFTKVGSGKGTPIAMTRGQSVSGVHAMERDGTIVAFGVRIGTYRGTADGGLALKLCAAGNCQEASKSVVDAKDNDFLVFELPQAMSVSTGTELAYTLTRGDDANHRVAVWSYPRAEAQTGLTGVDGAPLENVPRLSIHLQ